MLKKLLPAICALSITNVGASENWVVSSNLSPDIKMSVITLVDGSVVPYIAVLNRSICNGGNRDVSIGTVTAFNGKSVKMVEQCIAENILATWPGTPNGRAYVVAEMKSKPVLKVSPSGVSDFTFKTEGFKEAYSTLQTKSRLVSDAI